MESKKAKVKVLNIIFFILSFIAVMMMGCAYISAYGRYRFFQDGNLEVVNDYRETDYVKEYLGEAVKGFVSDLNTRDDYASIPKYGKIETINYDTGVYLEIDVSDYAKSIGKNYYSLLDEIFMNTGFSDKRGMYHYVDSRFNYAYDSFSDLSGFIVMKPSDYLDLLYTCGTEYKSGTEYSDVQKEVISEIEENYGVKLKDGDRFYIYDSKKYFIFFKDSREYINNYLGFCDIDSIEYYDKLYIPYDFVYTEYQMRNITPAELIEKQEIKNRILTAPFFENEMFAYISTLSSTQLESLKGNSNVSFDSLMSAPYVYINYGRGRSWDGQTVDKSNYKNERQKIIKTKCDFYVSFDNGKITTFTYDNKGDIKQLDALYKDDITELEANENNDEISFIIGIRPNSLRVGQYYTPFNLEELQFTFEFCKYIANPLAVITLGTVVFLICIIAMTILAGRTFDKDGNAKVEIAPGDNIPLEFFVFVLLMMVAGYFFLKTVAVQYIRSLKIENDNTPLLISICFAAGLMYAIFIWIYLSIVRRIKLKIFFGNTLVASFFRKVSKSIDYFSLKTRGKRWAAVKAGILFIVNIAAFFSILFIDSDDIWLIICIALVFDVIAMARYIKYSVQINKVLTEFDKLDQGDFDVFIDTSEYSGDLKALGESVNKIGEVLRNKVDISTKDERLKAELITNVSHDIKTPLTSIISYIDLLKRENIENENAKKYIEILENKSLRLKNLTLDLIEASKVSTGAIQLEKMNFDLSEFLNQLCGEYEQKFVDSNLTLVVDIPETPVIINGDGRRLFRAFGNLFVNAYKYALSSTRVYISLKVVDNSAIFRIKNISRDQLNISPEELKERFVRGDKSRYTEGSGLGLSISENLIKLHDGELNIIIDGDYYTAEVILPLKEAEDKEE